MSPRVRSTFRRSKRDFPTYDTMIALGFNREEAIKEIRHKRELKAYIQERARGARKKKRAGARLSWTDEFYLRAGEIGEGLIPK